MQQQGRASRFFFSSENEPPHIHERADMEWDDLTPEQQRQVEADHADFERQLLRVGVDLRAASAHMNEIEPPRISEMSGEEGEESFTESFTVDFPGILATLRQLPDGAGTSAFVAAYNSQHPDWRHRR